MNVPIPPLSKKLSVFTVALTVLMMAPQLQLTTETVHSVLYLCGVYIVVQGVVDCATVLSKAWTEHAPKSPLIVPPDSDDSKPAV